MNSNRTHYSARHIAFSLLGALILAGAAISSIPAAFAQEAGPDDGHQRLFQQFVYDPAMTTQWWEIQFRAFSGAVPPIPGADGWAMGPVIAISPTKNLELGGSVFFTDYSLDNSIGGPGNTNFDGASGAGDIELFGKYRFVNGPTQWAVGGTLTLPTGSESDGLGTGKLVPAVFGAVRHDFGGVRGVAHLGARFNQDADLFGDTVNGELGGKVSVFAGAGILGQVGSLKTLTWTGEVTVETERYEAQDGFDSDPDVRITAGMDWVPVKHHMIRGAVSGGLTDASPDFELILGYAYHF